jgi:phage terminase Nu1 subunit (DNA packaging protein)
MSTQKEVGENLDLSDRRVRELIKTGILPGSKGNGGLDIDACRLSYIRHLRGLASGQVRINEDDLELNQERAKLAVQQERKLKRENDLAEKMIAPVSLITEAIAKTASQIIPIMDSLPLEMKRRNPQLTGHDIMLVKKSIAKCRNLIAESRITDLDH